MAAPISGIATTASLAGPLTPTVDPGAGTSDASFADTLRRALGDVTDLQESAQGAITAFLRGDDVELHQVMAAAEEAGIAVELLIEVRNRLVEAYRTLTNMQG